jgi:hypothetical protein
MVVWKDRDTLAIEKLVVREGAERGKYIRGDWEGEGYGVMGPYCVLKCNLVVVREGDCCGGGCFC